MDCGSKFIGGKRFCLNVRRGKLPYRVPVHAEFILEILSLGQTLVVERCEMIIVTGKKKKKSMVWSVSQGKRLPYICVREEEGRKLHSKYAEFNM